MAHNRINENRMIDSETGIKSNLKLLGAANLSRFINIIFSESDSTTFICCRRIFFTVIGPQCGHYYAWCRTTALAASGGSDDVIKLRLSHPLVVAKKILRAPWNCTETFTARWQHASVVYKSRGWSETGSYILLASLSLRWDTCL